MYTMEDIEAVDVEIAQAIKDEFDRQNSHIELIASENWVSPAVMSAMGSVLTNKYAEGYPGKRYYGGCDCVDAVEELARERAKKLFGCDYIVVDHFNGFHCVAVLGNLRGFLTKFQGSFYVGGLHFLAIVEFHALSQLEYPLGIAYDLIGFC